MISTLCWVPRGAAKPSPDKYELSAEEVEQIKALEERDASEESGKREEGGVAGEIDMGVSSAGAVPFEAGGLTNAMYHADNAEDPYITLNDEDGSDAEDFDVSPSDALLVVGRTEEEFSSIEVHVYSEETGSFYVHHDFNLPSFPLCVTWLGQVASEGTNSANFVAVGTFKPGIEIWNLDVLDVLEPSIILGGEAAPGLPSRQKKGKKKKGRRKRRGVIELVPDSHTDAVMSLSWNSLQSSFLASGSADKTVKVWDVQTAECMATFKHHTDKVQCVSWNPAEASVLATGAFDHTVCIMDARDPSSVVRYPVTADLECLEWNPHNPAVFAASTEDGNVVAYDVRAARDAATDAPTPLFTISAHSEATSSLSFSARAPGLMATASVDKTIKLWDTTAEPVCIGSRSMALGPLFCAQFYPGNPFLLAAGGSEDAVALWETAENAEVSRRFRGKVVDAPLAAAAAPAAAPAAAAQQEVATAEAVAAPSSSDAVDMEEVTVSLEAGDAAAAATPEVVAKKSKKKKKKKGKKQ